MNEWGLLREIDTNHPPVDLEGPLEQDWEGGFVFARESYDFPLRNLILKVPSTCPHRDIQ